MSVLRSDLASMLKADAPASLFVGPTWPGLDHDGAITDRVFPGTITPCPYVEQGSVVRVHVAGALSLADVRRVVVQVAVDLMNTRSVDGNPSPYELVYGVQPPEDTSGWGALSAVPISWGRPDLPPHPDEGIAWSNISDRANRAQWDISKGSVTPPPPAVAGNLFADRGDGFRLLHLRRNGENAMSMTIRPEYVSSTIRPEYVSSRTKNGERKSVTEMQKNKEQASSSTESGEKIPRLTESGERGRRIFSGRSLEV